MNTPDGPEQRTAFYDECAQLDDEFDALLSDEADTDIDLAMIGDEE
jgi:hypothetical protein